MNNVIIWSRVGIDRGNKTMWIADIDLRLLRVFKAVADAGGFMNAQDRLGINQPAISSHIANLEERIGARLCNRGRGGFSLTAVGREVLTEAELLFTQIDASSKKLSAVGKKAKLMARVGVVDGMLTDPGNPLTKCIRETRAAFRDMRVRVGVYDHLDCIAELRAKRLDICLVGIEDPDVLPADLDKQHLFDERAGFYCAPDHPCAQAQDESERLLQLRSARISAHSFVHNPVDDDLDVILSDENVELAQRTVESTLYLALSGTHVGLIPDHIAAPWVSQGELIPIAEERFHVISAFHALRLHGPKPHKALERLWIELKGAVTV